MQATEIISEFEAKLETQIKECFSKELYNESDEFYIAADYDTKCRINDLVEKIGLQVYGMSVDEAEFVIRFEFVNEYSDISNAPTYCKISFNNEGEYDFFIHKSDLESRWWCSVRDTVFNHIDLDEQIIKDVVANMSEVQIIKQLKLN